MRGGKVQVLTPSLQEVIVDMEIVQQREEYENARNILMALIEERGSVQMVDMFVLMHWLVKTNNFTEDAAAVLDVWMQENDFQISDEFEYYRSIMEEAPTSR